MIDRFFDWLQQSGLPLIEDATGWFIVLCIIQIPLLLFRWTRRWAGETFYGVSFLCGFTFWLLCLVITFRSLGMWWMFFGAMMAGIGIVPLAFVGVAIHRQWSALFPLFLFMIAIYLLRGFGVWIRERCDRQQSANETRMPEIGHTE